MSDKPTADELLFNTKNSISWDDLKENVDALDALCKAGDLPRVWRATPREQQFLSLLDGASGEMMGQLSERHVVDQDRIAALEAENAEVKRGLAAAEKVVKALREVPHDKWCIVRITPDLDCDCVLNSAEMRDVRVALAAQEKTP